MFKTFIIVFFILFFSKTYANNLYNDTLKLCSNEYQYCINITNPNSLLELKHANNGSFSFSIKEYLTKGVVVATNYNVTDGLNVNFLKNELFQGWREMDIKNWTTRHSFEQDNTATFIYTSLENKVLKTTYRFVKYNNTNGYIELYATYPTKHEHIIKPMLEQMANSITIQ